MVMKDLDRVMSKVQTLESRLIRFVFSSFAFSLLGVIAQYDKFDLTFQALTELLAGITGSAGLISAFLGRFRHPADEARDLLDFNPEYSGMQTGGYLIISAAFFSVFYYFASQSNQVGLLFLCAGVFLFFRGLAIAVLVMEKIDLQRQYWYSLSLEYRSSWLENRREILRLLREAEDSKVESKKLVESINMTMKEIKAQKRRDVIGRIRRAPLELTRRVREKVGGDHLLTLEEQQQNLELTQYMENFFDDFHKGHIVSIKNGTVRGYPSEAGDLVIYEIGAWKYFFLEGTISRENGQAIVEALTGFEKDSNGQFKTLAGIVPAAASLTLEAKSFFQKAGIVLKDIPAVEVSATTAADERPPLPEP